MAYFGKTFSERLIARACRSDNASGTTGVNLVRGARRLGFEARLVDGANLGTVHRWLTRDVPVIVDWMSAIARRPSKVLLPCGHYSVVCGLDRHDILLQDPALGRRRRISRRDFLGLWYDFIGARASRQELIVRRLIVVRPRTRTPSGPSLR